MSDKTPHSDPCRSCPITWVVKALRLPKPPLFLVAVPVLGFCILLLVSAIIYKARFDTSAEPRILIPQDMARQPKYKAQADTTFFADGRIMRVPVAGTVAYGSGSFGPAAPEANRLKADDHFYRGYKLTAAGAPEIKADGKNKQLVFFTGYPDKSQLTLDGALFKLGQTKFNQDCIMCHGKDGSGQGPVNERAHALSAEEPLAGAKDNPTGTHWTAPADLRLPQFGEAAGFSNGRLFFTINHGAGAMAGYGNQLSEKEGWAIVAYVRALQRVAQPIQ